jgi:sulfite reductase alpha subunit-like flavoprotein
MSPNDWHGNADVSISHVAFSAQTNIHWYSTTVSALLDAYSIDVVQSDLISETLVLFVISTTGSGAEPRAMSLMWKTLLRSDLPADLFDDLSFAVFGLGDTSYEKFCWPAKKLSRRLVSLGATEICDRGEGDDQDPLG